MKKEKKKVCIFCDKQNDSKSIEHIIPESLGNKYYLLLKGHVCDNCNNKFSKFENKALTNSVFVMERARLGLPTKKGKPAVGKVKELEIRGSEEFKKQIVSIGGLDGKSVSNFNPDTGEFKIKVQAFDKSEVATSKLVLKVALESIYKSKKYIFRKYNFQKLKDFVLGKTTDDWPFITATKEQSKFISVPAMYDKFRLNHIECSLRIFESDTELLFKFTFGGVTIFINLLERSIKWAQNYVDNEEHVSVYPEHFKKRLDFPQEENI